jgi:hypothetical protein
VGVSGEIARDPGVSPLKRASFWRRAAAAFVRLWGLWLVGFLLLTLPPLYHAVKPPVPPDPDPEKPKPSGAHWAEARELDRILGKDDLEALVAFLRRRTLTADERARVQGLIDQLGDNSFRKRNSAADNLRQMTPRVAGMLRRAMRHPDLEITSRARALEARVSLPRDLHTSLIQGIRRLAEPPSPLAVTVLLDYLPDAETEHLVMEVRAALNRIAADQAKPDPELVRALHDPLPERRLAAGLILIRFEEQRPAIRKLLDDPDAEVRHQLALAFLTYEEQGSLRALIELLPVLDAPEAWAALDLLYQAAGVSGPAVPLGKNERERNRCRDAWLAWWRREKGRVDFKEVKARLEPKTVPAALLEGGPTLLVQMDLRSQRGEVLEITSGGNVLWHIDDLSCPVWASPLPNNRVLVVEYGADRVSERDPSGEDREVVAVKRPVFAQRLPDGSTFVASRDALYEVDSGGGPRELVRWPERIVATARRCRDGQTLVLTEGGSCRFLDRAGKETRRFETGCQLVLAPGIDVTANNRVLVPDHAGNRVVEFAPTGEVLWEAEVASPTSVQRLPDGNTLVASTTTRKIVELDRTGRIVWQPKVVPRDGSLRGSLARPVVAVRY